MLILTSSTFSFPLQELASLLDNATTFVESDYVMVRGLGITLENSLIGQKIVGAPSNLLQKEKGKGSPGIVTSLPWWGNFKH